MTRHLRPHLAQVPETPEFRIPPHPRTPASAVADSSSERMGNRASVRRVEHLVRRRSGRALDVPEITVSGASPLPSVSTEFDLPGPAAAPAGLGPEERRVGKEPQHRCETLVPSTDEEDDGGHDDDGGATTPCSSRKHFLELMMSSSPQVRRSMAPHNSDSDSASLLEEDHRASVTLDPLEHEWMMCSSDGQWSELCRLLESEPALLLRKDFVTGFNCLHWAAKHGRLELIALIVNFAKQNAVPIDVDARSSGGYTPLHLAAMQNHLDVVKLLVGAYGADVEARDFSGRKACQYLTGTVDADIRDIVGEEARGDEVQQKPVNRWRFSKVLQSSLKPLSECDSVNASCSSREKPVRRRSSFSAMKPRLERLRVRTSQVLHSTSFRDAEETQRSRRGSFRPRAKSSFFGS